MALFLSSYIQVSLYDINLEKSGEAAATVLAFAMVIICFMVPFVILHRIHQLRSGVITAKEFYFKYSTLTQAINTRTFL
jgi:hypothetical protein